jgi:hypothetical protein
MSVHNHQTNSSGVVCLILLGHAVAFALTNLFSHRLGSEKLGNKKSPTEINLIGLL